LNTDRLCLSCTQARDQPALSCENHGQTVPVHVQARIAAILQGVNMSTYQVSLLPGEGIGPEVAEATRRVLDATGIRFEWEVCDAGQGAVEKTGDLLPKATIESIRKNGIGLKGPITTPVWSGFRSVN